MKVRDEETVDAEEVNSCTVDRGVGGESRDANKDKRAIV